MIGRSAPDELWGYTRVVRAVGAEARLTARVLRGSRVARAVWREEVAATFAEATLRVPDNAWSIRGGRDGLPEHLGFLLAEMPVHAARVSGQRW
jgi:ring-1,2-phenylacetyl-CoA epoxidase subunit PaaC